MTSPLRRTGAALVLVYAVLALATHALSEGAGRPLFDGFAPPAPYRWVKPPPEFAADNKPPEPAERTVPMGDAGSEPTNASTPDAQIIIGLPRGTIVPHPPDTAVLLRIVPRDAAQLGAIPPNLEVVTNAYQVTLSYQPSQQPVPDVTAVGSIALTAASASDTLLYSADGQQWTGQVSRPFGNTHGQLGLFLGTGYYVLAASPAVAATPTTTGPGGPDEGSGQFLAIVVAVAAAGGIGFAVVTVHRRRRQVSAVRRGKPKRRSP